MFKRKGQAAMEFLMTYGWAILVVLAAIGALAAFGVLRFDNLAPEDCKFGGGFDCVEKASARDTTITVGLVNSNGDYNISNPGVSSSAYDCSNITITPVEDTALWEEGDGASVAFEDCTSLPDGGERYEVELTFSVDSERTGVTQWFTGTVKGKVAP